MKILLKFCLFCVVTISPIYGGGPLPTIEFLFKQEDLPGDGYLVDKPLVSPFPKFANEAVKICVYGMWTLYSTENYGIGQAAKTTSFTVKGTGPGDCSSSPALATLMKNVKSMKALSKDLLQDKCWYYPARNFLCPGATCVENTEIKSCDTEIAMADLASFAGSFWITGSPTSTKYYKVCGKTDPANCVCLDVQANGPFAVSDLNYFPSRNPLKDLSVFTTNSMSKDMCATFSRPIGRALNVTIDY